MHKNIVFKNSFDNDDGGGDDDDDDDESCETVKIIKLQK